MMLLSFFTDASWENLHVVWHTVRLADAKYQPLHARSLLMGFWSNLFIFPQKHLLRTSLEPSQQGDSNEGHNIYFFFFILINRNEWRYRKRAVYMYANGQKACTSMQSDQNLSICTHHLWVPRNLRA